jgi:hypothetical protein
MERDSPPARYWHPRHEWRGFRVDRSGNWPVITLGWWTLEIVPGGFSARVKEVLEFGRRGPKGPR